MSGHLETLGLLVSGVILFGCGSRACLPGFGTASQILMAIVATFLGVTDAVRGRSVQVWTPAASRN